MKLLESLKVENLRLVVLKVTSSKYLIQSFFKKKEEENPERSTYLNAQMID